MNWLTRLIPSIGRSKETASKSKIPDGVWNNCPSCEAILYQPELEKAMLLVKSSMQHAAKLAVPLEVAVSNGKNWFQAHKI